MKYPFGTLPSSLRSGRGCLSFGFPPLSSQSINPQPGRGLGSELKNTFWPDLELLSLLNGLIWRILGLEASLESF